MFRSLSVPGTAEGAPPKLAEEASELRTAIEEVLALRQTAETLERQMQSEFQAAREAKARVRRSPAAEAGETPHYRTRRVETDPAPTVDRRDSIAATLAAFRAEVPVRERLRIFFVAVESNHAQEHQAVVDELAAIEAKCRKRLDWPEGLAIPVMVLRGEKSYQRLRMLVGEMASRYDSNTQRENALAATYAAERVEFFEGQLRGAIAQQERAAAQRQKHERRGEREQGERDGQQRAVEQLQQRAAALLVLDKVKK